MSANSVTCEKEIGTWTIRVNGIYIADFWSKKFAYELAFRLMKALK